MARHADGPLTPAQFQILLALADGILHGYGIAQEVERKTNGATELGPGTLYRSIKQLLAQGLIKEVEEPDPGDDAAGNRRRTYSLTPRGKVQVRNEAYRLRTLLRWADSTLGHET